MERKIFPGFARQCKDCAELLKKSGSNIPCGAAREMGNGEMFYPKITNDENGFNCEIFKKRWTVPSAIAEFLISGAKGIYSRLFSVQLNWMP